MSMRRTKPVSLDRVKIKDNFWGKRIEIMCNTAIPYQWEVLNDNVPGADKSHAVENFRIAAGESDGSFYGMPFQDSDVAKWIEAASYSLVLYPNSALEKTLDDLISTIKKAQQPDGYLNTYFTKAKPDKRWTDFSHGHELYCAGHLIEAAVAHFNATGKKELLQVVCKYADYIDSIIGPEEGKRKVYCGHPEIELALVKLYRATGNERYFRLAKYFVYERGKQPCFLADEPTFGWEAKDKWYGLDYHQAHKTVCEQREAEGHSVRAMYLYAAMADIAAETKDNSLIESLRALWHNVTSRRMYITGGIGSQSHGERFTFDYDLPNDTAYCETCAAIGLVFWAHRMLQLDCDSNYADTMERALYNAVLSGISLDGKRYFYVNPLEVYPEAVDKRFDLKHVKPERVQWFGCACCPPNIARLLTSLGQYIYTRNEKTLFVHLYIGNNNQIYFNGTKVDVSLRTDYPWNGGVSISISTQNEIEFGLALRIPGWCRKAGLKINGESIGEVKGGIVNGEISIDKGYAIINRLWKNGDSVELNLSMPVQLVRSNPIVRENAGKAAIQRGPLIYCLEEVDNGPNLWTISLHNNGELTAEFDEDIMGGIVIIKGNALRDDRTSWEDVLYRAEEIKKKPTEIKAVPYCMWGNRNAGEMLVWVRCD